MKYIFTYLLISSVGLLSGCAHTGSVSDDIRWQKNPIRELGRHGDEMGVYHGMYLGTVWMENALFYSYIFKSALAGDTSRVLHIYIPVDKNSKAWVQESVRKEGQGVAVTLLVGGAGIHPGDIAVPAISGIQNDRSATIAILLLQSFESFRLFVPKATLGMKTAGPWVEIKTKICLKWVVRRRSSVWLQRSRYLYAVPLDIFLAGIDAVKEWHLN